MILFFILSFNLLHPLVHFLQVSLLLKQAAKLNNYNKAHVEQLKPQQAATIVAMDGDKLDD